MAQTIEYRTDPMPPVSALHQLWLDAWPSPVSHDFARLLEHSLVHVGAFDGEALVGFANVAHDGAAHAFLSEVCVAEAYRHRGIGSRLVELAIDQTRKTPVQWLRVDYEANLANFYAKAGFVPTAAGLIKLGG